MTEKKKKTLVETAATCTAWAILACTCGFAAYTGMRLAEWVWPRPPLTMTHMLQGPAQ